MNNVGVRNLVLYFLDFKLLSIQRWEYVQFLNTVKKIFSIISTFVYYSDIYSETSVSGTWVTLPI